jgi:hypothetical protein
MTELNVVKLCMLKLLIENLYLNEQRIENYTFISM